MAQNGAGRPNLVDAEDVDEAVARRRRQQTQPRLGSRVLEAEHLGVVGLDLVQLVHELHVVDPVRGAAKEDVVEVSNTVFDSGQSVQLASPFTRVSTRLASGRVEWIDFSVARYGRSLELFWIDSP